MHAQSLVSAFNLQTCMQDAHSAMPSGLHLTFIQSYAIEFGCPDTGENFLTNTVHFVIIHNCIYACMITTLHGC